MYLSGVCFIYHAAFNFRINRFFFGGLASPGKRLFSNNATQRRIASIFFEPKNGFALSVNPISCVRYCALCHRISGW